MRADEARPAPCAVSGSSDRLPLAAIEVVRARPTERVVFAHAKIVAVMQGRVTIDSPAGPHELAAGDVFVLGAGVWCSAIPAQVVPTWTLYTDEAFLRAQAARLLPPAERVRAGMHPTVWDENTLVLHPGIAVLNEVEPLWRQMNLLTQAGASDLAASRLVGLFADATHLLIPALLHPDHAAVATRTVPLMPVLGRMTAQVTREQVRQAADLLREQMAEVWFGGPAGGE